MLKNHGNSKINWLISAHVATDNQTQSEIVKNVTNLVANVKRNKGLAIGVTEQ